MIGSICRALVAFFVAAALTAGAPAAAQDGGPLSVLDRMFGGSRGAQPAEPAQNTAGQPVAQASPAELIVRIDRLEAQIRQLTGTIEQLQHRNQQLEQQLRSTQASATPQAAQPAQPAQPPRPSVQASPVPAPAPAPAPAAPGGRRSDVFDPTQHPNAPGAPQTLGSVPANPVPPGTIMAPEPPVGVPGGRSAGAPLDLSTLATNIPGGSGGTHVASAPADAGQPGATTLPPPPPRNMSGTGATASVAPPSETAQGYYDLAYGYVQRKDYAFAEDAFQTFLRKYPNDRLVPDAQFWLGESLFQRQRYDAAAEAFLAVSTKHEGHAKAAEALLRLGQSLAALSQKEMACATLAEVGRKYPRAANNVKQGVEREQKRVRC